MISHRRRLGDGGSATIWLLNVAGVVSAVTAAIVLLGTGEVVSRATDAAADAAALSGALNVDAGSNQACAIAASTADRAGAVLAACVVTGADVEVTVTRALPGPIAVVGPVQAQAMAGPSGA